jgi:hypothetical protein
MRLLISGSQVRGLVRPRNLKARSGLDVWQSAGGFTKFLLCPYKLQYREGCDA